MNADVADLSPVAVPSGSSLPDKRHPARRHYDDSVALYWDFKNLHAGLMEAKYGEGAYAQAGPQLQGPGTAHRQAMDAVIEITKGESDHLLRVR